MLLQIQLNYNFCEEFNWEVIFDMYTYYLWLEDLIFPDLHVCAQPSLKKWEGLLNYNLMAKHWVYIVIDFPFTLLSILRTTLFIPLTKPWTVCAGNSFEVI